MGLFGLTIQKTKGKTTLTPEDRQVSLDMRQLKAEEKRLIQKRNIMEARADLALLRQELEDDNLLGNKNNDSERDIETRFLDMAETIIGKQMNNTTHPQTQQQTTPTPAGSQAQTGEILANVPDNILKKEIAKVPKDILQRYKVLEENDIFAILSSKFQQIDDDSIERAVKIIKNG